MPRSSASPDPQPVSERNVGVASLGLDDVVREALLIATHKGLSALSIRGVASALGISPMSVYRFVESKEELLDAMLRTVLDRMEIPYSADPDWRTRIVEVMTIWRDRLVEQPGAVEILIDRRVPPGSAGLGRVAEHVLAALEQGGHDGPAAARAFWQIFSLTLGHIMFARARSGIDSAAQADAARVMAITARDHGFDRVGRLARELTDVQTRGELREALYVFLEGLGSGMDRR